MRVKIYGLPFFTSYAVRTTGLVLSTVTYILSPSRFAMTLGLKLKIGGLSLNVSHTKPPDKICFRYFVNTNSGSGCSSES